MDSLHSMIAAHQDNFIESLDFGVLGPPSASYIVERRSTRIPFLAPTYSVDGVSTMRCVLADSGWVDEPSARNERGHGAVTALMLAARAGHTFHV